MFDGKTKIVPYLRIYYERSTGNMALDTGPGTRRIEAKNVNVTGTMTSEHSPHYMEKPRCWMVIKHALVKVIDNTAYVVGE